MEGILTQSFSVNMFLLRIIALYPPENYEYWHKIRAYVTFMFAMLPSFVFGFLQFFLNESAQREYLNDFVSAGMIFLTFKIFAFLINSDDIQKSINYFNETFVTVLKQKQKTIIEECIKISKRNSTIFIVGDILSLITWFGTLCFQDHRHYFPVNIWLPFETAEYPLLHYGIYFILMLGITYALLSCAAIDPLVSGLLCHAAGQIRLLKYNLKHLDHFDEEVTKSEMSESDIIYIKIRESILHYQKIVNFVNYFEKCFSSVVFAQFVESIVAIGFSLLQAIKIRTVNTQLLVSISYICVLLFQVYFYCYYGAILHEENNTLSDAVYMSRWYEYDMKSKRILMILVERSIRPMTLTAGKILEVSLETFIMILKRSYSLIAVLQNY